MILSPLLLAGAIAAYTHDNPALAVILGVLTLAALCGTFLEFRP